MKVYVDTCVVSGFAKSELSLPETEATARLLELHERAVIGLVTSPVTREELDRIPLTYRAVHDDVYAKLQSIPLASEVVLDLGFGIHLLSVRRSTMLQALETLLRDLNDARHIYNAWVSEARTLVTVDASTILSKATQVEAICGVRPTLPSLCVNSL